MPLCGQDRVLHPHPAVQGRMNLSESFCHSVVNSSCCHKCGDSFFPLLIFSINFIYLVTKICFSISVVTRGLNHSALRGIF